MVNYPNNKKISNSNFKSETHVGLSEKGMNLESMINQTNAYYVNNNIAFIYKKPVPITIGKVENKVVYGTKQSIITKAYFNEKSTTDYNGLYNGYYIDFEAKQTRYKTFNLKANLHQHQSNHLKSINEHGGFGFLIISFYTVDKIFLIDFDQILDYVDQHNSNIPLAFFEEHGEELKVSYNPQLDYIKSVDKLIAKRKLGVKNGNK